MTDAHRTGPSQAGTLAPIDLLAYPSFDSLEGVEGLPAARDGDGVPRRLQSAVQRLWPGVSIALVIGLAASWLADHYKAPVMLFALLLGMAVNFVSANARCRPGIDFAARTLLRIGVALLGARITIAQIESLGAPVLAVAGLGVVLTIASGWALARVLKLDQRMGLLTGGSVAICGASAALALSSVLPPSPERERDTMLTVVGVTALSTIAMITYPLLAAAIHLTQTQTGVFLGATIHDVAQVVGAGYSVSKTTGDTAAIVKLFRVALLLPAVLTVALVYRSANAAAAATDGAAARKRPPLLPMFLFGFAGLVLLNSVLKVPAQITDGAGEGSRWFLVTAIAALGAKTSLGELVKVGWRPIIMLMAETAVVLVWVLGCLLLGV
jgi:uncharacterized integral membrane protein (TIGR00698 family)